jgi:hypothetical protein
VKFNTYAIAPIILVASIVSASSGANAAPRLLEIENYVGRIDMRTSNSPDMNVVVTAGRKANAIVTNRGNISRVQGNFGRMDNVNCQTQNGRTTLTINGTKYSPEDLPVITATTNSIHGLRIRNSHISGQVGDIGGVSLGMQSCGDIVIGNILYDAQINIAGSGDVRVGNVGGQAEINIAGSGDATIGDIRRNLTANIAGSGDLRTGNIGGSADLNIAGSGNVDLAATPILNANVAGSGDILVRGGRGAVEATIVGSGDLNYRGTAISPKVRLLGTGDANFARTEGNGNQGRH